MICASIGRTRHKMMILEHRDLAQKGAELVELRIDWLTRVPDLGRLLRDRPTPVIVTCRRQSDRGRWKGTEDQRQALLRAAIVDEANYVDLEDDVAGSIPRYGQTKRIVSHHNFDETPDDLEEIHARLCELDPDIVKLVTMANSPGDTVRMLKLVESASVPTIGFCMGELGVASRVLCGKYGSPITYASFSSQRELAPGQVAFQEMKDLYRYENIDSETRVYGLLMGQTSQSADRPESLLHVHNMAFEHEGLNCVYLPFPVPKDLLAETLEEFQWLQLQGYSVVSPHQEAVLAAVEHCDGPVQEIGAADTLFRDADNQWHATNTGCRTGTGVELFVQQAAAQFECFTGQTAPLERMRETLRGGH